MVKISKPVPPKATTSMTDIAYATAPAETLEDYEETKGLARLFATSSRMSGDFSIEDLLYFVDNLQDNSELPKVGKGLARELIAWHLMRFCRDHSAMVYDLAATLDHASLAKEAAIASLALADVELSSNTSKSYRDRLASHECSTSEHSLTRNVYQTTFRAARLTFARGCLLTFTMKDHCQCTRSNAARFGQRDKASKMIWEKATSAACRQLTVANSPEEIVRGEVERHFFQYWTCGDCCHTLKGKVGDVGRRWKRVDEEVRF
ncbi:hypothetical protein P7C70_g107, partial [Phenoliferia sp. Uapishka_3]